MQRLHDPYRTTTAREQQLALEIRSRIDYLIASDNIIVLVDEKII